MINIAIATGHTKPRNMMSFITLVDTKCTMMTGMSHSNDPMVQQSDAQNSRNKIEDTG